MDDVSIQSKPDRAALFVTATAQHGFFTTRQAAQSGFSRRMLAHYARSGDFIRERRGIYRFRDYPVSPHAAIQAACLAAGAADAVVSHESALELHNLSDVVPRTVHLTVPRSRRGWRAPAGVTVHTATRPPESGEVVERAGLPVTAPARSIADAAAWGTAPDQIVTAVVDAMDRGMTTVEDLRTAARNRGQRVADLVGLGLSEVDSR